MLVIAQNLVQSDAAAIPDGTPLILIDNKVTIANITTDSEQTEYPVTNLANPATNQEWRGAADSPTPTEITIDLAINSVDMIDAVGIARHNFGTEQIAVAIYSVTADSPSDPVLLVGPQMPGDDKPVLFWFDEQSFHTLRIVLTVPASTVPRAAVLYTGKLIVCERGFDVASDFTPPRFSRRTVAVNGRSHAGDFLGRIITSQMIEGAPAIFKHFNADWYREQFDPFVEEAQTDKPFFFAWAPDDYPYDVELLWLAEDPIPLLSPVTGRFSISLKMDGIVE